MGSKYELTSRGSGKRYLKDEDFDEGDVWGTMDNVEIKNSSSPKLRNFKYSSSSSSTTSLCLPSTPRLIPRTTNLPLKGDTMMKQASAPMEIPERRRPIGSSKKCGSGVDYGDDDDDDDDDDVNHDENDDGFDDGDGGDYEDDDGEVVPPHEYIARRLARSQISSFSVCEGIGRTLKGRDLSYVRNTILRKTGFLES